MMHNFFLGPLVLSPCPASLLRCFACHVVFSTCRSVGKYRNLGRTPPPGPLALCLEPCSWQTNKLQRRAIDRWDDIVRGGDFLAGKWSLVHSSVHTEWEATRTGSPFLTSDTGDLVVEATQVTTGSLDVYTGDETTGRRRHPVGGETGLEFPSLGPSSAAYTRLVSML